MLAYFGSLLLADSGIVGAEFVVVVAAEFAQIAELQFVVEPKIISNQIKLILM